MKPIVRSILAVFAGAVVAFILIGVLQMSGYLVHPLPAGFDWTNEEAMKAHAAKAPALALVLVLLAYLIGTGTGAWLAARLARRAPLVHGMIIGVLFLATGIVNMLRIPHPMWFWVPGIIVFPLAAYGGARLAAGRKAQPQPMAQMV